MVIVAYNTCSLRKSLTCILSSWRKQWVDSIHSHADMPGHDSSPVHVFHSMKIFVINSYLTLGLSHQE